LTLVEPSDSMLSKDHKILGLRSIWSRVPS
jgi:hypothetical protein